MLYKSDSHFLTVIHLIGSFYRVLLDTIPLDFGILNFGRKFWHLIQHSNNYIACWGFMFITRISCLVTILTNKTFNISDFYQNSTKLVWVSLQYL